MIPSHEVIVDGVHAAYRDGLSAAQELGREHVTANPKAQVRIETTYGQIRAWVFERELDAWVETTAAGS